MNKSKESLLPKLSVTRPVTIIMNRNGAVGRRLYRFHVPWANTLFDDMREYSSSCSPSIS